MGSLVPSGGSLMPQAHVTKQTRAQLATVRQNVMVQAEAEEGKFLLGRQQIRNAYLLGHGAVEEQVALHTHISQRAAGDPGLEMVLREMTSGITEGVKYKLWSYLQ